MVVARLVINYVNQSSSHIIIPIMNHAHAIELTEIQQWLIENFIESRLPMSFKAASCE